MAFCGSPSFGTANLFARGLGPTHCLPPPPPCSGPVLASRTASEMICRHLPGPVRTTDFWSVSSGTSSARLITEVLHPENLLTEPFSLNCKQIGKFECDAISLQSNRASETCTERGFSQPASAARLRSSPRRQPPGWPRTVFIFFN